MQLVLLLKSSPDCPLSNSSQYAMKFFCPIFVWYRIVQEHGVVRCARAPRHCEQAHTTLHLRALAGRHADGVPPIGAPGTCSALSTMTLQAIGHLQLTILAAPVPTAGHCFTVGAYRPELQPELHRVSEPSWSRCSTLCHPVGSDAAAACGVRQALGPFHRACPCASCRSWLLVHSPGPSQQALDL